MKGQQLLDGTLIGYPSDMLRVMNQAFDQAWQSIERRYADPRLRQAARLRLASVIVDVTPRTGADLDMVMRMAFDLFMILDRDDPLE